MELSIKSSLLNKTPKPMSPVNMTTQPAASNSLKLRIKSYLRESVVRKKINNLDLKSKGLLMLTPYAAAMGLSLEKAQAQTCVETLGTPFPNLSLAYNTANPVIPLDIDGNPGYDVQIEARGGSIYGYYSRFFVLAPFPGFTGNISIIGFTRTFAIYPYNQQYASNIPNGQLLGSFPTTRRVPDSAVLAGIRYATNVSVYPSVYPRTFFGILYSTVNPYFPSLLATGTGIVGLKVNGSEGWIKLNVFADDASGGIFSQLNITGFGFENGDDGIDDVLAGDCGAVLPVEFNSFTAVNFEDYNLLEWSTLQESNNQGFVIERSTNGRNFKRVGWINGAGNSKMEESYQYKDSDILPNRVYYYRLKQIDFDGQFNVSKIVSAQWNKRDIPLINGVYPNPNSIDLLHFDVNIETLESLDFQIFDQSGSLLITKSIMTDERQQKITVDISNLNSGSYVAKVISNKSFSYHKFVVID